MKHTPGPWKCIPTSHHAHDYRLELPNGQMPFERGAGTEYANAALIAATPDLLEALDNLVYAVQSETEPHGRMVDAIERAKVLVNKLKESA